MPFVHIAAERPAEVPRAAGARDVKMTRKYFALICIRLAAWYVVGYLVCAAMMYFVASEYAPFRWPRPYPPLFAVLWELGVAAVLALILAIAYVTRKPDSPKARQKGE